MDAPAPTNRRGDPPLTVWRGSYRFGRSDSFFNRVVTFAKQSANREPEKRPPEADFLAELEGFRAIAPVNGRVLLDQIEYRWRHPDCSDALYAITCTLLAPPHRALIAESGEHVQELPCIKIGKARRCVAARLKRYNVDPINRVWLARGSQTLRVLVYGDGDKMLDEDAIKKFAKRSGGSYAYVIEETGRQRKVSPEVFVGARVIDAICARARESARS